MLTKILRYLKLCKMILSWSHDQKLLAQYKKAPCITIMNNPEPHLEYCQMTSITLAQY